VDQTSFMTPAEIDFEMLMALKKNYVNVSP